MRNRWIAAAMFCGILATPAAAQTAAELAQKNVEAKGGAAAIAALKSVRMTGKMFINNGQFAMALLESRQRPDSIRVDVTMQGLTITHAYDGKDGWQVSPFQGRKDPERMSADDIKGLQEQADIGGALADWQAEGSTLAYLGTEDIDGTPAHKLKVSRKNGDVQYVFLDPEYFLEIRMETQRSVRGVQQEIVTDLSNYEKVAGVYLPFALESGPRGSSNRQKIEYAKAEANPSLDPGLFRFPAAPTQAQP